MSEQFASSIVIPAYNEQHRILPTLEYLLAYIREHDLSAEIIVVDDGSSDQTAQLVESYASESPSLSLRRTPEHRGKGSAVRAGFLAAQGETIYLCDADLNSGFSESVKLREVLLSGADVAIGSRPKAMQLGHKRPWYRFAGGRLFNLSAKRLLGLNFHDTQCGLKAFKRAAAKQLCVHQRIEGWGFDLELLLLARSLGYRVVEVPLDFRHDYTTSKFRLIGDGIASFTDLVRILWHDIAGSYPRRAEVLDSVNEQLSLRYFLHQVSRNLRASSDVVADR